MWRAVAECPFVASETCDATVNGNLRLYLQWIRTVHLEQDGITLVTDIHNRQLQHLWVVQNCHHFQASIQSTVGGGGINGRCMLFKNVDYDALHMHTGSLKINIFKELFWEGGKGSQKDYSEYAFDNVDNYGRPLTLQQDIKRHTYVNIILVCLHLHLSTSFFLRISNPVERSILALLNKFVHREVNNTFQIIPVGIEATFECIHWWCRDDYLWQTVPWVNDSHGEELLELGGGAMTTCCSYLNLQWLNRDFVYAVCTSIMSPLLRR